MTLVPVIFLFEPPLILCSSGLVKTRERAVSSSIVRVQEGEDPAQDPPQEEKVEPACGVAVKVRVVESGRVLTQSEAQEIFSPVTDPPPVPWKVMESVASSGGTSSTML